MKLEFEKGLTSLRKQGQQVDAEVAQANDAMSRSSHEVEESTRRQQELQGRIAPLEQMLAKVSAGRKAADARRAEAQTVILKATAALDKLQKRLDGAIPRASSAKVQTAIDTESSAVAG